MEVFLVIIAIKWIIGSQYNFITDEKYCHFTSLKRFLEVLRWRFAYILSVNIAEIHKTRPLLHNTWNPLYVQPETFYTEQYVLPLLQPCHPEHIFGNSELFPCNHSNVTQQWHWGGTSAGEGKPKHCPWNQQKTPQKTPSILPSPPKKSLRKTQCVFLNELILFCAADFLFGSAVILLSAFPNDTEK